MLFLTTKSQKHKGLFQGIIQGILAVWKGPEIQWNKIKYIYQLHYFIFYWNIVDRNVGKDWGQEQKGMTDEMVGWHHRLNRWEFEQIPGDSEGQGNLECWSS